MTLPIGFEFRQFVWYEAVASTYIMEIAFGYVCKYVGQVLFTLPTKSVVGDYICVIGSGSGGWKIAQNTGQQILFLSKDTTLGIFGFLESTTNRDQIHLVCTTDDLVWTVVNSCGNITIV